MAVRRRKTREEIARQRERLKVRTAIVAAQEKKEQATDELRNLRVKLRSM